MPKDPSPGLFSLMLMILKLDVGISEMLDYYWIIYEEKRENGAGRSLGWQPCRALDGKKDSHLERWRRGKKDRLRILTGKICRGSLHWPNLLSCSVRSGCCFLQNCLLARGTFEKGRVQDPNPDILNQELRRWGPVICVSQDHRILEACFLQRSLTCEETLFCLLTPFTRKVVIK